LSPTDLQVEPTPLVCFAVRVRTRGEELVANLLRQKNFQVFAPTFTELRRYSDRVCRVTSALFPGYIFVRMESRDLRRLLSTNGVSYVVRNGEAAGSLSCHETRAIEALCRGSESREPCGYLRVGQRVRIESGPFIGVEGVLVKVRDVGRVVITVDSLCSSVSVQIGPNRIRLLDERDGFVSGNHGASTALADRRLPA
jgi:transcription antitermination factor NusG